MLEAALERRVETREEACPAICRGPGAMLLTLQQQTNRYRCQSTRQAIGSEHREDNGEAEWREQIFRRPLKEDHRGKDATDRQSRDQRRHGDFGSAMQCRAG